MRLFFRYISIFLISVLIIDSLATITLDKIISHSKIRYVRMLSEDYSMVILGNSRGVNSVSEGIFERTHEENIINLSHNGLSKDEIFYISQHIRDSTIVFIECTSFLWDTSKMELKPHRLNVFKNLRESEFRVLKTNVFNHEIFLRSLYYIFSSDEDWTNNGVMSKDKLEFITSNLIPCSKQLNYRKEEFSILFESLMARGITPVFYISPVREEKVSEYTNWDEVLAQIESDFPNFLNLTDSVTDIESFADLVHTNKREIKKVHSAIMDEFKRITIKPTNISADGF